MQCCLTPLLEFTKSCFSTDNEVSLQAMGLEPESRHIVGDVFRCPVGQWHISALCRKTYMAIVYLDRE